MFSAGIAMKKAILIVSLFVIGCAPFVYHSVDFESLYGPSAPKQRVLTQEEAEVSRQQKQVSFYRDVKPILDSRCVVCHGCYDAPCQLKLGSIEGIDRGASKNLVYDFVRFKPADPTRLYVDARDTEGWRKKEFFPVLNERIDTHVANLGNSVLSKLIELKRQYPLPTSGKLGKEYDLEFDHTLQCTTVEEFPKYQHEHPQWGMPYALPGLTIKEENTLKQWLLEGARAEPLPPVSKQAAKLVDQWERFFNGASLKEKLVFRYIFEHLFIGHMHFKGRPYTEFFRWVRSTTPPGQPVDEIPSVRPYDDPGGRFYYRLQPVTETIVDKIHFVYELSDEKMRRYDELFLQPEYSVTALPTYQPKVAANPFEAFIQLPLVSKYRFLLDDSYYFVSGFIKGPVCRGKIATESIRDQFWVLFIEPGKFSPKEIAQALSKNAQILGLPGEEGDQIGLMDWTTFDDFGKQYLKTKDQFIDSILPRERGFGLEHIWDGEGSNPNAALTIFRHYNSATVMKGLIGATPLTAWVIDYPLFERLHYMLVAGFSVYGTAGHQLASRTYMDILRQDGEDNFLRFMPAKDRHAIHESWYRGFTGLRTADAFFSANHETSIRYQTSDYKKEFFDQVRQHLGQAAGEADSINGCKQSPCERANTNDVERRVDDALRRLAQLKGLDVSALPEMSLLRVKTGDRNGDLVYSLLVNKAYKNISNMLFEGPRRQPEKDSLTVYPGIIGSYPNFFFTVEMERLDEFVEAIRQAQSGPELENLYAQFGVRRTNPEIWQTLDWFNAQQALYKGVESGLLDMSRYENL